jgi:hypothetical protein
MSEDKIYTNGVDVDTGTYAVPPMSVYELDALIRGEKEPENFNELRARAESPEVLGVKEGVDEKDLCQTGWGVIFADDADPAVEAALQPLLKLRKGQTGKRYHRYTFQVGQDSKDKFLARHGAGPGPADPDVVPYYLLIVGSPGKIPYRFQSQLDVQYAVGRLHFETPAEYRTYADSVVAAETGSVKLPRRAGFFSVTHPSPDTATDQGLEFLVKPLLQSLSNADGWSFDPVLGLDAKKGALEQRLGGAQTPALLFTASHGLRVRPGSQSKLTPAGHQGALICADWPGPGTPFEEKAFFFSGSDLGSDANLQGLIALFFACFSGGTPKLDAYTRLRRLQLGQQPGPALELAPQPFVAGLPRRMLGSPAGGALAVIGHVEQTWPSSYLWKRKEDGSLPPQIGSFESTLRRLMTGYPVGAAVEYLNIKYAELAAMLQPYLEAIQFGDAYDRVEFVNTWMAATDAQWYTIIGDPAVRLPVVESEEAQPRPGLLSTAAALVPDPRDDQAAEPGPETASASRAKPAQRTKEEPVQTSTPADPRFAHPYSPATAPTKELAKLKDQYPDLYEAYVKHVKEGYENNGRIFDDVRRAFMRSHNSTVAMYWILFAVGVSAVVAGIVLAVIRKEVVAGAVFAGLGAASFIGYFITRSIQSVEENLVYITWLGVIYNSYWTHLAWATQRDTAQAELDKATTDALQQLAALVDRHAESLKGRPKLRRGDEQPAEQTGSGGETQAPDTSGS